MDFSLRRARTKSEFAYIPRHPPTDEKLICSQNWTRTKRNDLALLSRDATRCWLHLYTGKDHLRYHQYTRCHRGRTPNCTCSDEPQTVQHFLTSCTLPQVKDHRAYMQEQYKEVHISYSRCFQRDHGYQWAHKNKWRHHNYANAMFFTHPPTFYPSWIRQRIMKLIVDLYRKGVGYERIQSIYI